MTTWRKSSYSGYNGNCVMVALGPEVWVVDSKDPDGPVLKFSDAEWMEFLGQMKADELHTYVAEAMADPAFAEAYWQIPTKVPDLTEVPLDELAKRKGPGFNSAI